MSHFGNIIRKVLHVKYLFITAFAFLAMGGLAFVTLNISFLSPVTQIVKNFSLSDIYYQISQSIGHREKSVGITLVDMTLLYDRADIAQALKDVESLEPKTVGVDIVFEGLLDESCGNDSIAQVASQYDNIVWSFRVMNYVDSEVGYADAMHSFFADTMSIDEGCTNMERSLYGNTKRQLSMYTTLQGNVYPSFVSRLVGKYTDKAEDSQPAYELLDINFMPTEFTILSADSVLAHPELIRNRIVLFGAMYEETDMHYTPIGKMAGMELLAYALQTLIDHKSVSELPGFWFWTITAVLVYLTMLLQDSFIALARRIRNGMLSDLVSSSYVVTIVTFIWMALLLGISFVLFSLYNFSFNLGWAFAAMAFLEISKDLWEAGAHRIHFRQH